MQNTLYEKIKNSINQELSDLFDETNRLNELSNNTDDTTLFNKLDEIFTSKLIGLNINIHISKRLNIDRILKKVAGYLIEETIKKLIRCSQKIHQYKDNLDGYYDFSINGKNFEIKAFQKGTLYSNVHLTEKQKANKNQLTFILVQYCVVNEQINVINFAIVDGVDIETTNDKINSKSNITFKISNN